MRHDRYRFNAVDLQCNEFSADGRICLRCQETQDSDSAEDEP